MKILTNHFLKGLSKPLGRSVLLVFAAGTSAATPGPDEILKTLTPTHPRLLLSSAKIEDLRAVMKQNEIAERSYQKIKLETDGILREEPVRYELRDGRRLIYVSADVMARVRDLAFVHLITRERKYADRAWEELEAASKFKDWNPEHFLDTAIMTKAFAIGLDWLWNEWTPAQREVLRKAIVEKGLAPAMKVYGSNRGWHTASHNWNQVCNGGIGLGALAVADTDSELAGSILRHAVESIPTAMKAYAPDGATHEGVSYWGFGSLYNILLMEGLQTALGTDLGLGEVDGFRLSGDYPIYLSGTNQMAFDFGDCTLSPSSSPQHLWMGRRYGVPRYTWFRHHVLSEGQRGKLWDILWLDANSSGFSPDSMPPDKHFRGAEVASMRDSWADESGFIIAMQGGRNGASHRHLDLGSFILESDGVRWIVDSGKDQETYQRHLNNVDRNDFYRIRAEGHNTVVVNPDGKPDQDPAGEAKFTGFDSKKARAAALLDLTGAYEKDVENLTRLFELERGKHFTITDKIRCRKPSEIWSFFHTAAKVEFSGDRRTAILKQAGKTLKVRLGLPTDAVFLLLPAKPFPVSPNPPTQASNEGRSKLGIRLSSVKETVIAVRFERPK